MIFFLKKKCLKSQAIDLLKKCSSNGDLEAKQLLIYLQHLRSTNNDTSNILDSNLQILLKKMLKDRIHASFDIKRTLRIKKRSRKNKNNKTSTEQEAKD